MRNRLIKILLLTWFLLFLMVLGSKLYLPGIYQYFTREDSFSEYVQSLNYFLASVFSFITVVFAVKNKQFILSFLYTILGIGLLFVSLEEISWGQRIFDISNPDYFSRNNVQKELTIHNLNTVQPYLRHVYIAISAYGAFAWILSYLLFSKNMSNCKSIVNYVVADWFLAPYFFICFSIYAFLHYVRLYMFKNRIGTDWGEDFWFFLHWRDEEHGELFLSFGFVFFVILSLIRLKKCLKQIKA